MKLHILMGVFILLLSACVLEGEEKSTCISLEELNIRDADGEQKLNLIRELSLVINNENECTLAFILRGYLYYETGQLNLSLQDFLHVMKVDSTHLYSIFCLGKIFYDQQEYSIAARYFQKVLELKFESGYAADINAELPVRGQLPEVNTFDVIFRQGLAYFHCKDFKSSKDRFDYCIMQNHLVMESYTYRGIVNLEMGDTSSACQDLRHAITLGSVIAQNWVGNCPNINY